MIQLKDISAGYQGKTVVKNITLDFGGATIVLHGKIQPFLLDGAENITIKNCNFQAEKENSFVNCENITME